MKELDNLLKKYKSLESTCNLIDRLKWGQEDLAGLRDKIRTNISMLTAFNSTLTKYVHLICSLIINLFLLELPEFVK